MTAAGAAREWWAAHRRRSRESVRSFVRDGKNSRTLRMTLFLPVFLAGAMIVFAAIGFAVTELGESRFQAERHAALRLALDEFGGASGDVVGQFDDARLRLIERRAGVTDLRFDAAPTPDDGRELQSLHDARGRIIGWFSWSADSAHFRA